MGFLEKARRLESKIARRVDGAAQELVGSGAREPLETLHSILEAVGHEIQPGGRGRRLFPFNEIAVTVLAPSPAARARLEAIIAGERPLQDRIVERLRSAGCEVGRLVVDVKYVARPQKGWTTPDYHVDFARTTSVETPVVRDLKPVRLELKVLRGVADRQTYVFTAERINLGRCGEVRDNRNRLIRANDLAFAEASGDVNQSVSRQHAHISRAAATGHYRLHDDGSAHGTSVVRSGKTMTVPTGARGVRLQSGDEILLGEARLRVKIDEEK